MNSRADTALHLPIESLERLMPLHVRVDSTGLIAGCGPTLAKLAGEPGLTGQPLFEAFELRRPAGRRSVADLAAHAGERLRLTLRQSRRPVALRGLAMPLSGGAGMILNLSFGIGVVEAVRNLGLTDADFAATDLAVEMMYLVEAKTAAMETLRGFAVRMQDDKITAETQAMTDTLTGLRNRRALAHTLERMTRAGLAFGLMHIDLDFFKAVNDTFGHAAGDQVLRVVAQVLNREIRAQDTVARVGGDEFVALFPDLTGQRELASIAERIIAELTQPIPYEGNHCRISASIGITTSDQYKVPEIARMQHDADEALYAAKRAGRKQVWFHEGGDPVPPSHKPSGRRTP